MTDQNDDMQTMLLYMRRYGKPRMTAFDDGTWLVAVAFENPDEGFSAEVKSDYSCKTPLIATMQCYERLRRAVSAFETAKQPLLVSNLSN